VKESQLKISFVRSYAGEISNPALLQKASVFCRRSSKAKPYASDVFQGHPPGISINDKRFLHLQIKPYQIGKRKIYLNSNSIKGNIETNSWGTKRVSLQRAI
jgi:hypothetical protein